MSIRRKPEFDRFTAGLSQRVNGWLNDEDYNPQDLINLVRAELSRIWKYLIEKINTQEKDLETLRKENEELNRKLKVAVEALGRIANGTRRGFEISDCYFALGKIQADK